MCSDKIPEKEGKETVFPSVVWMTCNHTYIALEQMICSMMAIPPSFHFFFTSSEGVYMKTFRRGSFFIN